MIKRLFFPLLVCGILIAGCSESTIVESDNADSQGSLEEQENFYSNGLDYAAKGNLSEAEFLERVSAIISSITENQLVASKQFKTWSKRSSNRSDDAKFNYAKGLVEKNNWLSGGVQKEIEKLIKHYPEAADYTQEQWGQLIQDVVTSNSVSAGKQTSVSYGLPAGCTDCHAAYVIDYQAATFTLQASSAACFLVSLGLSPIGGIICAAAAIIMYDIEL